MSEEKQDWQEKIFTAVEDYRVAHLAYIDANKAYHAAEEEDDRAIAVCHRTHAKRMDALSESSEAQGREKEALQALNKLLEEGTWERRAI